MKFSVGQQLDGVEFLRVLSSSGPNVAYLVRDMITGRLEYLKLVPGGPARNEETVERFLREARLHARLKHPNIAQFYSARYVGGDLTMTREWIEGESLASKLAGGPLGVYRAVDYIGQALLALEYAHGQGVVHRNITSDNLLITESGIVKLTGFDLARGAADLRLTRAGVTLGSVHYMAPEQIRGLAHADERSDLYAVGVVLYEAITGKRPFEGDSHFDVMLAQVEQGLKPPSRLNETVPPEVDAVVMRALAKDPGQRYQAAADFRRELVQTVREREEDLAEPAATAELAEEPAPVAPPPLPEPEPLKSPEVISSVAASEWDAGSSEPAKTLGIALIGFGLGLALFLGGLLLLNQ